MTPRRVEISRVHFWTFSPVSVKIFKSEFVNILMLSVFVTKIKIKAFLIKSNILNLLKSL